MGGEEKVKKKKKASSPLADGVNTERGSRVGLHKEEAWKLL